MLRNSDLVSDKTARLPFTMRAYALNDCSRGSRHDRCRDDGASGVLLWSPHQETAIAFHKFRAFGCRGIRFRLFKETLSALVVPRRAEPPSVARILGSLSTAVNESRVDDVSWTPGAELSRRMSAVVEFGRRMEDSILARIGSSARADAEARAAAMAARVLASDSEYEPLPAQSVPPSNLPHPLKAFLPEGVQVLVGPGWLADSPQGSIGARATLDSVRVSERRGGAPYGISGTISQISTHMATTDWRGRFSQHEQTILGDRAAAIARDDIAKDSDAYNGVFPRLLKWRIELGRGQSARRLHLLIERTTFFTWRVVNHARTEEVRRVANDEALFIDHAGDATDACGALHLPVVLSLITSDGYLVLRTRSHSADFSPGFIESAANGNAEIEALPGTHCDRDENGLVDFAAAVHRELVEELGPVPLLATPRLAAMVVVSGEGEERAPVLLFEAKTAATFQRVEQSFQAADPTEGYHESTGDLFGLPVFPDDQLASQAVTFLLTDRVRVITQAASLVALGNAWGTAVPQPALLDSDGLGSVKRGNRIARSA